MLKGAKVKTISLRKPSAKDVLWLLENKYLCETGSHDCALEGPEMIRAYTFAHVANGNCSNLHTNGRIAFWKEFKKEKAIEKAWEKNDMKTWRKLKGLPPEKK
jgi:hypothetical protein